MGLPTEVKVRAGAEVVWPRRCLRCGSAAADCEYVLKSSRARGSFSFRRERAEARVPVCLACGPTMRQERVLRVVVACVGVGGAACAFVVLGGLGIQPRLLGKAAAAGALIAGGLPWFVWWIVKPPVVSMDFRKDGVVFEFRDGRVAAEFSRLNAEAVVRS